MRSLAFSLLTLLLASAASAQMQVAPVHIRVLSALSGRPVRRAHASAVMYPETAFSSPIEFTTDRHGTASLLLLTTSEVSVTVSHHAACDYRRTSDRKKLGPTAYPVQSILGTGIIGNDTCSHRHPHPSPGQLVIFVRPSHWWGRLAY